MKKERRVRAMMKSAWGGSSVPSHTHYCGYARHIWEHNATTHYCWSTYARVETARGKSLECPDCTRRRETVATMILPAICDRCGVWKRTPDGRACYVTMAWIKGRRIVCPECQEAETTMNDLHDLLEGSDDIEVPF